jgi:hypothetical protein
MTATTHLRRAPGSPRRAGKRAAVVVAGVAVTVGAVWSVIGGATGDAGRSAPIGVPTATAPVERRDLVDRQDVDGALTFTGSRKILASTAGTVTRLRPEGSTVRRGQSLFSIDAKATAYVMYGSVPMYRALSAGVADGSDIRQLERNLVALGYDPYDALDVDSTWDSATTAAVLRWEKARGATRDGVVEQGDVVFSDGPARVGAHEADVGDPVSAHAPVLELTSRRRVVVARLAASRQGLVHTGDSVRVTLPDGRPVRGRVTSVGRVATAGDDGAEATVELRVVLRGHAARRAHLDRAPVTVSIATDTAKGVLAVPVTALVATAAGRYAVEVVDAGGARRLVPVKLGAFADGYVEVSGAGLREGVQVTVPR